MKYIYEVFEDATVINKNKGKIIKTTADKRRPGSSPLVYFKRVDGGRNMFRLDELMANLFIEAYNPNLKITHIDGNVENCALTNLKLVNPLEYIHEILGNEEMWMKIHLDDVELFYDYYISEYGKVFNGTTYNIVKPFIDDRTHLSNTRVSLYVDCKTTIKYLVSRLVALHFIPNKSKDKLSVYFKDGDHNNLHYTNLAWGDRHDVLNNAVINSPDKVDLFDNIFGNEKWVSIDIGCEFYYEYMVSNFGRIYNKTHRKIIMLTRGASNVNNQSWLFANFRLADGSYQKMLIHRIVAKHFVPNDDPENRTQINHINGNPEFNFYFNLEWVTQEENAAHAISTNLLHSRSFDHMVNDIDWRTRSIMAWISSIIGISINERYIFYSKYVSNYENFLPILSYENFINYHTQHYNIDNDYTKLYDFYNQYYTLDMSSTTGES